MEIAIRTENLSKTFRVGFLARKLKAVEDLSLQVQRAEIFVLDGPMSGVDPIGRKDVRDIIFALRREGRTVLFSTHILSDVEAICDTVGIMIGGRLTDCGTLSRLLEPGVRAVEIVARGIPDHVLRGLVERGAEAMERDGATVLTFSSEPPAQEAVKVIVAAGGVLVSLSPHRETLESLFVQRARAGVLAEA